MISGTSMQTEKDNRESSLEVNIMNVPNNFFEFMNIPILSGHVLKTNSDMVADRKLVERIKKDLLGTTLYNYQDSYTVCGICSDFVFRTCPERMGIFINSKKLLGTFIILTSRLLSRLSFSVCMLVPEIPFR